MANAFSREERVAFEELQEAFNDSMVISKNVSVYKTDQTMMARTNDIVNLPMPYIARSFDGADQTSNFKDQTQLSVPATIGYYKSSPWKLTALELRDNLREGTLGKEARQKLASDINVAVMNVASLQGSLVVKRTTAASGFNDVAECEAMFNEQGIQQGDRYIALNTRDYNKMAGDLAGRGTLTGKPLTAYEKAYIGQVASFEAYKMDYAYRLPAALGGSITMSTLDAAVQYYIPKATSTASTGEIGNVDNRKQLITVSSTTNVAAGDCFTIAGVNAVHHITKADTGQLKTFRVLAVNSGTTMTISPPIISNQVAADASAQYQNCVANTKSATAAITWLNTTAAPINPFWHKDAISILPGRIEVPSDAGTNVMRGATDQGIEIVMQKFYDIKTSDILYRIDTLFGVVNKQPEMSGIMLFGQA